MTERYSFVERAEKRAAAERVLRLVQVSDEVSDHPQTHDRPVEAKALTGRKD